LNPAHEKQLAAAMRAVEEARRAAHRDPARLGELVENINVLAELRLQEGSFPKAESLYREVLFRIKELRKPDPELLIGLYSLLANLYERWGKHKEASDFYRQALDCADKLGGDASSRTAVVKNNLAILYKGMRDYDKAAQYYEEALQIAQKIQGGNTVEAAGILNNLGVLLYQNMDLDGALDMHVKALTIREGLDPSLVNVDDLSQNYFNLGAVYKALGDFQKAQQCLEHARKLALDKPTDDHPPRRSFATLILDKSA
jgi:tetratricopeptide (TPR) repeat protein